MVVSGQTRCLPILTWSSFWKADIACLNDFACFQRSKSVGGLRRRTLVAEFWTLAEGHRLTTLELPSSDPSGQTRYFRSLFMRRFEMQPRRICTILLPKELTDSCMLALACSWCIVHDSHRRSRGHHTWSFKKWTPQAKPGACLDQPLLGKQQRPACTIFATKRSSIMDACLHQPASGTEFTAAIKWARALHSKCTLSGQTRCLPSLSF